ncbi:hypothetical protein MNBD_UNCLBAC01-2096, partial [hydrothermal vent metagenome]
MKLIIKVVLILSIFLNISPIVGAQGVMEKILDFGSDTIFDDQKLLEGYAHKYQEFSKQTLLAMIKDDTLDAYKIAAAVRVFNKRFSTEVVSREKKRVEKLLWRRLHKTESPFVEVEIMYALCRMDRYRYFKSMSIALIQKLDHYNKAVNELAFEYLTVLTDNGNGRAREARRVFNTLRKVLFLSRKRIAKVEKPDARLIQKIKLIRWAIKILGTQEIRKLPKEVLN